MRVSLCVDHTLKLLWEFHCGFLKFIHSPHSIKLMRLSLQVSEPRFATNFRSYESFSVCGYWNFMRVSSAVSTLSAFTLTVHSVKLMRLWLWVSKLTSPHTLKPLWGFILIGTFYMRVLLWLIWSDSAKPMRHALHPTHLPERRGERLKFLGSHCIANSIKKKVVRQKSVLTNLSNQRLNLRRS